MMKLSISVISYLLSFGLITTGCNEQDSVIESQRIKSPDGEVDAVLVKRNGGATTSFSYNLFVLSKETTKEKFAVDYSIFIADHVKDIKIAWIENKILQIDCKSARIFRFSNFWQSKDVENYQYIVEIRIAPNCRL